MSTESDHLFIWRMFLIKFYSNLVKLDQRPAVKLDQKQPGKPCLHPDLGADRVDMGSQVERVQDRHAGSLRGCVQALDRCMPTGGGGSIHDTW